MTLADQRGNAPNQPRRATLESRNGQRSTKSSVRSPHHRPIVLKHTRYLSFPTETSDQTSFIIRMPHRLSMPTLLGTARHPAKILRAAVSSWRPSSSPWPADGNDRVANLLERGEQRAAQTRRSAFLLQQKRRTEDRLRDQKTRRARDPPHQRGPRTLRVRDPRLASGSWRKSAPSRLTRTGLRSPYQEARQQEAPEEKPGREPGLLSCVVTSEWRKDPSQWISTSNPSNPRSSLGTASPRWDSTRSSSEP